MPLTKPLRGRLPRRTHILARDCAAKYIANEGVGNLLNDLSGNRNTGTFQGTAPSWSPEKFGSAVLLPGTNEYIEGSIQTIQEPLTIAGWFRPNVANADQTVIAIGTEGAGNHYWAVQFTDAGKIRIVQKDDVFLSVEGGSYSAGERIFVAVVFPTTSSRFLYENGIQTASDTTSKSTNASSYFVISGYPDHSSYLNGLCDNVMIYNRILSASGIALLYKNPFADFKHRRYGRC